MDEGAFFKRIRELVVSARFRISEHALDALIEDELGRSDITGLDFGSEVLEFYPDFAKGRATLLYQLTKDGRAVHCVWGIPKGFEEPAVLITAYIPDPSKWDAQLKVRR